jgi:hypothetical protein
MIEYIETYVQAAAAQTPAWLNSVLQREKVLAESQPLGPFGFPGYGTILDAQATDSSRPEFAAARRAGLVLRYYLCPHRQLRAATVSVVSLAMRAHRHAVASQQPELLIDGGDKAPMKFRYSRETEVATVVAWPSGDIFAAKGTIDSRRTTDQLAFLCSTHLAGLPVADRRSPPARRRQAVAVAIATISVALGLPLPPYPYHSDRPGHTAHQMAANAGLGYLLRNWR